MECNLVQNHSHLITKIGQARSASSIWNQKHDFRPNLHDTKFNYHLITAISKSQHSFSTNIFDLVDGLLKSRNKQALTSHLDNVALKRAKRSRTEFHHFVLTTKTTQPSPGFFCQWFNNLQPGCTFDVILMSSVQNDKILSKLILVNNSWLWWIMPVALTNQKQGNILNE